LSHANLSHANLSHANLSHANLSYANLSDANLSRANLSHANLSVLKTDRWDVFFDFRAESIRIGCQYHTVTAWREFSDAEIARMNSEAIAWWMVWKPAIMAIAETKMEGRG
jgi:hypothetical protein